jgi:WASH complex subunit 7
MNRIHIEHYRNFIYHTIKQNIIEPLSKKIETNLRIHVHGKYKNDINDDNESMNNISSSDIIINDNHYDHNNSSNENNIKALSLNLLKPFLDLSSIHILGMVINIKYDVIHYLNKNFYNLTALAVHDSVVYNEMKNVAKEKLDILLIDNYLPSGVLNHSVDTLEIMRNINVFIGKYNYDMFLSQFIEYKVNNKSIKYLNVVKIPCIVASIRQHGLGILSTTVNYTYQYLISKFTIFNQFLYDNNFKSHLMKECQWYEKNKNEDTINNSYPYDRALKFVKKMQNLGGIFLTIIMLILYVDVYIYIYICTY